MKSPKGENDVNYCDKVQAEVRKAQEISSDNDDGNSGQASNYASISQDDFTRCEMPSLADSNCQIRFYHNHIDDNKHFRHGDHVQVSFDKKSIIDRLRYFLQMLNVIKYIHFLYFLFALKMISF